MTNWLKLCSTSMAGQFLAVSQIDSPEKFVQAANQHSVHLRIEYYRESLDIKIWILDTSSTEAI